MTTVTSHASLSIVNASCRRQHCSHYFYNSVKSISTLILLSIYLDATDAEQKRAPSSSLASQGQAYSIEPGSTITRGSRFAPKEVYPPIGKITIADARLRLRDVLFNPRNVILQFEYGEQELWLQVRYFHIFSSVICAEHLCRFLYPYRSKCSLTPLFRSLVQSMG